MPAVMDNIASIPRASRGALSLASARLGARTSEEMGLDEIERGSRSGACQGRQRTKPFVDYEMLRGLFDEDEVDYDLAASRRFSEGSVYLKSNPELISEEQGLFAEGGDPDPRDFRDYLDAAECGCNGDQVCLRCCTQSDLVGISASDLKDIQKIDVREVVVGGRLVEMFDIVTQAWVARLVGWI